MLDLMSCITKNNKHFKKMLPPLAARLLVHSSLFLDPAMTGPFPGSVAAGTLPKVGVAAAVIFGVRGPQTRQKTEQKLTLLGAKGRDLVSGLNNFKKENSPVSFLV